MKRCILASAVVVLLTLVAARPARSQTSDPRVAQAVLPLPADLRDGATVLVYDARTGDRQILRQGTNNLECQPKGADGFTWCYNKVTAPRRDLQAKLKAQGKSDKEVSDAVAEATKAGTLKPTPFGTMSYRLSGDDGRIKLLWVMSVPMATPESLGVSTVSQRDAALKGSGLPWLMLPGTPGAHVMIPINPGTGSGTK